MKVGPFALRRGRWESAQELGLTNVEELFRAGLVIGIALRYSNAAFLGSSCRLEGLALSAGRRISFSGDSGTLNADARH